MDVLLWSVLRHLPGTACRWWHEFKFVAVHYLQHNLSEKEIADGCNLFEMMLLTWFAIGFLSFCYLVALFLDKENN